MTGLEPRDFTWVIADRLAVSERIGGYGLIHRRVRREEEIEWIKAAGVTSVLSLLDGNHNEAAYEAAGLGFHNIPVTDMELEQVEPVFETLSHLLADRSQVVLMHRDIVDDTVAGILGGYLVHSGMIEDPIVATAAIQEILGRPLGPEARRLIPEPT